MVRQNAAVLVTDIDTYTSISIDAGAHPGAREPRFIQCRRGGPRSRSAGRIVRDQLAENIGIGLVAI